MKFSVDVNGWLGYLMPYKYCRKFEPPEYGARALQSYRRQTDRQTDGRAIAYSEREREFTFAKNDEKALKETPIVGALQIRSWTWSLVLVLVGYSCTGSVVAERAHRSAHWS